MENIHEYIFGYHNQLEEVRNSVKSDHVPIVTKLSTERDQNMRAIRTYNLVKNAIWSCVLDDISVTKRSEQKVSLVLLRDILAEIKILLAFTELNARYQIRLN